MLLAMGVTSFPKVIASSVWIVSVQSKVANAFLPTANYLMSQQNTLPLFVDGDVTILQRQNMLYFLKRRLKDAPIIYSHADIEQIVGLLEPFTEVSREEKQQHIENLQTKCPYCGKPLVLRKGKYGQFWGCSAYPKCHFTRNVE